MNKQKLVWYVCYGSNLLKERFLCYLKGGVIPGNTRSERGAKDPSTPVRVENIIIPHRLFFSLFSEKWDGSGVAFIDPERDEFARTYGRRYLITEEQFFDVVRQENGLPEDAPIEFDEEALKRDGSVVLFEDSYYGRLMYLGEHQEYPMYSFTCVPPKSEMMETPLEGAYYDVIAAGLHETYGFDEDEITRYLAPYI